MSRFLHRSWRKARDLSARNARRFRSQSSAAASPRDRRLSLEALEERQLLTVVPELLKDINQMPNPAADASVENFLTIGATTYFSANDGTHGKELWKTDGTDVGTVLVKDLFPGPAGSSPAELVNLNGTLYFVAGDDVTGRELWKSDGTAAGTQRVADLNVGPASANPRGLVVWGSNLYFAADDGSGTGVELYKSNGTAITRVKDINPAGSSNPTSLVAAGSSLFFSATDSTGDTELWKTDGSELGTVRVKDIRATGSSSPANLVALGATLFFTANDGTTGVEVWKSDGSDAGTVRVADLQPGATGSAPNSLVTMGGSLYFVATTNAQGTELFKTDGTTTAIVKDIVPGTSSALPRSLVAVGTTLYFVANDAYAGNPGAGVEVWKTDGTSTGTQLVRDINPGGAWSSPANLTAMNGSLYFTANDGVSGVELWKTDGTLLGTTMIGDIMGGAGSSSPSNLAAAGNRLYFGATDGTSGRQLWQSDGLTASKVVNINRGTLGSTPQNIISTGTTAYFTANDGLTGIELWKTDLSTGGTQRVADIYPGAGASNPSHLTLVGTWVYFAATDGSGDTELWKSDGTAANTQRVKDINSAGSSSPQELVNLNGTLYFSAVDNTGDRELWRTDPVNGAVRVADINPTGSSNPTGLVAYKDQVFFAATDGTTGYELWKSDGTPGGTQRVRDIYVGASSSAPLQLTVAGDNLFFSATTYDGLGFDDRELWKTDGTTAGTARVRNISIFDSSTPENLTAVGNILYFSALDDENGIELWKSDGTFAGTTMVSDINPGPNWSFPYNLTNINGTLYFVADDGTHGAELWKSVGGTTELVADINPGTDEYGQPLSSSPNYLANVSGAVYFQADDGVHGLEPWVSDGTAAGTTLIQDLYPGIDTNGNPYSSNPLFLTRVQSSLLFSANDGINGRELWVLRANMPPTDILLSNDTIDENGGQHLVVGTLTAVDPDAGDTHTFAIVPGAGDTDNGLFELVGNVLQAKDSINHEAKPTCSIRIQTTDRMGLTFEKIFTINIRDLNDPPTDLLLAPTSLNEDQPADTPVGLFTTVDEDVADTFEYTIIGGTDAAQFKIVGNQLRTNAVLDFEVKQFYEIQVRSRDSGGATVDKSFTITLNEINDLPTNITLTPSSIDEHLPPGSKVGDLGTVDQDVGDTFTYALMGGAPDNAFFTIAGSELRANVSFNFETRTSYTVHVQSTDARGGTIEKDLTISVNNVNEAPTNLTLFPNTVERAQPAGTFVGNFTTTDPDAGQTFTYSLVAGTGSDDNARFQIVGDQLQTSQPLTGVSYSIRVRSQDQGGLYIERVFTINTTGDRPPVAVPDLYTLLDSLTISVPAAQGVLTNDSDPDGDSLTALLQQTTTKGTLTFRSDGSFDYVRTDLTPGRDSFTYRAYDNLLQSGIATVTLNVRPLGAPDIYNLSDAGSVIVGAASGVLSNDSDLDSTPADPETLHAELVSTVGHGTLTLNDDGSFTYTRTAGYAGRDSFVYRAFDGKAYSNNITVYLNNAPVAVDDIYDLSSAGAITVVAPGVFANDTDSNGDALVQILITQGPTQGALTPQNNGSFVYNRTNPNPSTGRDFFRYRVFDGLSWSNEATVVLNHPPTAVTNTYVFNEGESLAITAPGVLANDVDKDRDPLTAVLDTAPISPTFTFNPDGSFSYTRTNVPADQHDSFSYRTSDGRITSGATLVVLDVLPVSADDHYEMVEGSGISVGLDRGLLLNDRDLDDPDSALQVQLVRAPVGTLQLFANGTFNYSRNPGQTGPDSFTYRVWDGYGYSNEATVTFNVQPVAVNDLYVMDGGGQLVVSAPGVLTNDRDPDQGIMEVHLVADATGILDLRPDGSFTYQRRPGQTGIDTFSYRVWDGRVYSNVANVTIDTRPVAIRDYYDMQAGTTLEVLDPAQGVLANDNDFETPWANLVAEVVNPPISYGLNAANFVFNPNGTFKYTRDPSQTGPDWFTYRVWDGVTVDGQKVYSYEAMVYLNNRPVANDDFYSLDETAELRVDQAHGLLANDVDVDATGLTVEVLTMPTAGTLTWYPDGSFVYQRNPGVSGVDNFTYRVWDGFVWSTAATVTFETRPVAVADYYEMDEGTTLVVPTYINGNLTQKGLLENDYDRDNDALVVELVSPVPGSGLTLLDNTGSFQYTRQPGQVGLFTFQYRVFDGFLYSNTVTVTINNRPVIDPDVYAMDEGTTLVVGAAEGLLRGDHDIEGAQMTVELVAPPAGLLNLAADGSFSYTRRAGQVGTEPDKFSYRVWDGLGYSAVNYVTIDNRPTVIDGRYSANQGVPLVTDAATGLATLTRDIDAKKANLTYHLVQPPVGNLTLDESTGAFTYTRQVGQVGGDQFTFYVWDGVGNEMLDELPFHSRIATVKINVLPIAADHTYDADIYGNVSIGAPGVLAGAVDQDNTSPFLQAELVSDSDLVGIGPQNTLLRFNPAKILATKPVTGLEPGDVIVGLDWRLADGLIYAVAHGAADRIYTVNLLDGKATLVSTLSVALRGNSFGVDFDPVADRLRIVSDAGQNLRVNVATGEAIEDVQLNPGNPTVVALAYSNNVAGALSTTLYTIDTAADVLSIQNPPNGGTQLVVGPLGVDATDVAGFEIVPGSNRAFASLTVGGVTGLYQISLATGAATLANRIGTGLTPVGSLTALPSAGQVNLATDGSFSFTRAQGSLPGGGRQSFTYKVYDGIDFSAPAMVTINAKPVARADEYRTGEDQPLVIGAPGLLLNDDDMDGVFPNDPRGDELDVADYTFPTFGALHLDAKEGTFTYTPQLNFSGTDSFRYRITDGGQFSDYVTVTIIVEPRNDPPTAIDDQYTNSGDNILRIPTRGVLANDTDLETLPVNLQSLKASDPAFGTVTMGTDGSFVYTPNLGSSATDTFTYWAFDGEAYSNLATVTITSTPPVEFLTLDVLPEVWEGVGEVANAGTVYTSRVEPFDRSISLFTSDPRIRVPDTITLPANQSSAKFSVFVSDDPDAEANRMVTITAGTRGSRVGQDNMLVHDNDLRQFTFATINSPEAGKTWFPCSIYARNTSGDLLPSYAGDITLTATSPAGPLPLRVQGYTGTAISMEASTGTYVVAVDGLATGAALNVIETRNAQHLGWSNAFDVTAGPLHHFTWGSVSPANKPGNGFPVTVEARDANDLRVTSFSGPAYVSAWGAADLPAKLLITEMGEGTPDYVEIQNVSRSAVNTKGWVVAVNDASNGNVNAVSRTVWKLDNPAKADLVAPSEVLYRSDDPNDHYWGDNINWGDATAKGWAMIVDNLGNVVDFAAWGYSAYDISSLNVTINGFAIKYNNQWTGGGVVYGGLTGATLQRKGSVDHGDATDFVWQTASKGLNNQSLASPFSPLAVTPSPTTPLTFVNGVWQGMVSVQDSASQATLWIDDRAGHGGASGSFAVSGAVASMATPGMYDPAGSRFFLRNSHSAGPADYAYNYGVAGLGWVELVGDWNGDGIQTAGMYDPASSTFFLKNTHNGGDADLVFNFGVGGLGWQPIVGDWDGDGRDSVGLYAPNTATFFLRNSYSAGPADYAFDYGVAGQGWKPLAGNWDNAGGDTVGLYDPANSAFFLRNVHAGGAADLMYSFGVGGQGWLPLVGDWNGDGYTTAGVFVPASNTFFLKNTHSGGAHDLMYSYGVAGLGWRPIVGDWNGPGSALRAESVAAAAPLDLPPVANAALDAIAAAALNQWEQTGIGAQRMADLRSASLVWTDLPGDLLARTDGSTIWLDRDAAGHGWFVDPTPADDAEFRPAPDGTSRAMVAEALDRVDLMTVVAHELGHVGGLLDQEAATQSLMDQTLGTGVRRHVGPRELDALFGEDA